MPDGDYLLAGVGGGLRGLIEAYKVKLERETEQAKVRQSGFNQVVTPKVAPDQTLGLEQLALARQKAAEDARQNAQAEADRQTGFGLEKERLDAMKKYRDTIGNRGTEAINPITGEVTTIPKGARIVTPPGAADSAKNLRTAENLLNILDLQEKRSKGLPRGRAYGRGTNILNKLTGWNPDAGVFQSIHEATIPVFSRVIGGEVGNLAEQEQTRAAKINPNLTQTPEEMEQIIAFTREILQGKMELNRRAMSGGMFPGGNAVGEGGAPQGFTPAKAARLEELRRKKAAGELR